MAYCAIMRILVEQVGEWWQVAGRASSNDAEGRRLLKLEWRVSKVDRAAGRPPMRPDGDERRGPRSG